MTTQDDFLRDWHYAVDRDFIKDGQVAHWASSHPAPWGAESTSITLDSELSAACTTTDEKYMAVAAGKNIHIYDTASLARVELVRTTGAFVSNIEWQPQSTTGSHDGYRLLATFGPRYGNVSSSLVMTWKLNAGGEIKLERESAEQDYDGADHDAFWQHRRLQGEPVNIQALAGTAAADVASLLQHRYHYPPGPAVNDALTSGFEKVLQGIVADNDMASKWEFATSGRMYGFDASAFSHDGRFILVESRSGLGSPTKLPKDCCDVWDVTERRQRARLAVDVQFDHIVWAGWSPDDKIVATSCWDGTLALWDVGNMESAKLKHMLGPSHGQNWTAAFSPDGRMIAHGCGALAYPVRIWDVDSGAHVLSVTCVPPWSRTLAWSPDSKTLALGASRGELAVIDIPGRRVKQSWKLKFEHDIQGVFLEIRGMYIVDGGRKLLFATGSDCGVGLYDFEKNEKWRVAPTLKDFDHMGDGWVSSPGLWLRKRRQLMTLGRDNKLRFWKVD